MNKWGQGSRVKTISRHQMAHAFPLFHSFEQLYSFICNVYVRLRGAPQGILVSFFLLDKAILEDETQNTEAALQAHKTWNTSWKIS